MEGFWHVIINIYYYLQAQIFFMQFYVAGYLRPESS